MNRKQKIIVSTTGIFLVLLILVGLTYAYFLTRINGNKNDKSISVSTANLELVYAEVNDTLISATNVEPGVSFTKMFSATNNGNKKIEEYGVALENVINTLERTEDLVYTISCTQYLKQGYSITKDGNNYTVNGTTSGTCNGVSDEQIFPTMGKILITNSIEDDKVQVYTLVVTYKDTGTDQSIDMNKQFSAKANLVNPSTFGPMGNGTLASAIIENGAEVDYPGEFNDSNGYAKTLINCLDILGLGAKVSCYKENTGFNKNVKTINKSVNIDRLAGDITYYSNNNFFENAGLYSMLDDYGFSYYFRGPILNNYINFAGMCWRIVRIAGDGSIKLILEDQDSTCATSDGNWDIPTTTGGSTKTGNIGYTQYDANTLTASDGTQNSRAMYLMNYLNGGTDNDKSMATAFKNFQNGPLANYLDKLKAGDWCLNDKAYASETDNTISLTSQEMLDKQIKSETFYYDSYVRLKGKKTKEPTLKCNGTNMNKFSDNTNMYVGTLTADETALAGTTYDFDSPGGQYEGKYYLYNDFQFDNKIYMLTMTPRIYYYHDNSFGFGYNSSGTFNTESSGGSLRPSINLKPGIKITGDGIGTKEKPYEILIN